jgi:hypothetical protein
MSRKVFTAGEVLAATDVNSFLMDQTVMSFPGTAARGSAIGSATVGMVSYLEDIDSLSVNNGTAWTVDRTIQVFGGTAARGSAIPTPVEGMYAHLNDTDTLTYYNGSAWANAGSSKILQVVSATKTDTFSTSATTFQDITGLSVTITPAATSSKIMVFASVFASSPSSNTTLFGLLRDSTAIARSTTAETVNAGAFMADIVSSQGYTVATNFLDSPSTTSATVYKVAMRQNSGGTGWVNRRNSDNGFGGVSSITVMEVAG